MKRITIGAIAAVVAGFTFMLVGASGALAAALSCDTETGVPGAGECQITLVHAVTGAVEVDRTLHIFGTGRLDASGGGIVLNICVAPAPAFSTCDLILDTPAPLVVPPATGGGQIEASDVIGNDNASDITINVSRDVIMGANSAVLAENTHSGGHGGAIAITVGRDMTMSALATISVSGSGSSGNSPAGSITITVGDAAGHTAGTFTMDPTSQVLANSSQASAGAIEIVAGLQMDVDGLVQSASTLSGVPNQPPGGGPITLVSGCKLTVSDAGKVSSSGHDPGADLVHLEGCDVTIYGLVESIAPGAGHVLPTNPPNHCNLDPTAHPNGASIGYSACVEIWGNNVTIDSTGTHHGEVSADGIRNPLRAWIDVFARKNITIIANTTGNYSVHANAAVTGPTSGANGGLINIKAQGGKVLATAAVAGNVGLAIQANATGDARTGGDVFVQAGGPAGSGQVDFTADSVQAEGSAGHGGSINVQSFNDGIAGLAAGELNAINGAVNLTACVGDPSLTYAGTVSGVFTPAGPGVGCGGTPTFPTVAHFLTGQTVTTFFTSHATLCDVTCGPTCTPSGQKFNDLLGNGVKDAGDPGVSGVQIHIFDKATAGATLHQHTLTDGSGNYSFSVPPGEYIVCEQGGPAPFSPPQTFPAADGSGGLCATHTTVTGSRGYDIVLSVDVNQCTSPNNDFGNFFGASISGNKFNDLNGNGVKDAGDPPVSGLEIHLFDKATAGTTFHQHTSTDASGNFSFTSIPPGEYIVCEQGGPAPFSPAQTFPAADGSGGMCATHTTIAGSRGYDIVLATNQASVGNDFGNFFGGFISGQKFSDLTGNGVKDAGDPPIPGLEIHLFDKATGTTVHLHQNTDASGNYSFGPLQPGEYIVCEQGGPPAQTFPAADGSGGLCATHTTVTGSRGYDIVLSANQSVTGNDFGNAPPTVPPPGSLSGNKFEDLTGNGIKDPGDPGLQGIQIHVFDKATSGATFHAHTLSDVNGNFSFANVPVGEYIVCEQGGPPTQTFPAADGSGGLCATHTGVAGSRGYDITVASNLNTGGNDFGNRVVRQPPPPTQIPTLDEYGLLALAVLLGLAGVLAQRRRRYPGAR